MSGGTSAWRVAPLSSSRSGAEEPIVSLVEIMSEELAEQMSVEEALAADDDATLPDVAGPSSAPVCDDDDMVLAQLLQHEFDREHDAMLAREQAKFNGNNKVVVSYERYKTSHPVEQSESSDDEDDDDWRELATSRRYSPKSPAFPPSGLLRQADGTLITKHDKTINGRKNVSKVLDFPTDFQTGDAAGDDLQLPNQVYNELKSHSQHVGRRRNRVKDKTDRATADLAVDAATRLVIFKLINGGLLDSVSGSVATGKESTVLHAYGGEAMDDREREVPAECALKIYKTSLCEFKNRGEYMMDDYRFKNPRKVLRYWAEKEMLNLNRMARGGIRCPTAVRLRKNVLVMSFVGADALPAPKLKDAARQLDADELRAAYDDCVEIVKLLYEKCNLVHADLSEFNVLYWEGHCWVIDVAQAVDALHPRALEFLARDCHNLVTFFGAVGLVDVASGRQLFSDVTGIQLDADGDDFFGEVQRLVTDADAVERLADKKRPADSELRKERDDDGLFD